MTEQKASLEVTEGNEVELTEVEKKKLEKKNAKEKKKMEQYARTMVTRAEAHQIAEFTANQEVAGFAEFIREPLRANLVQTMALIELLKAKGIIESDEEFQSFLDLVADKLKEEEKEAEAEVEKDAEAEEAK